MIATIRKCDHMGSTILAEFDTEQDQSVQLARDKLMRFLADCVKRLGGFPPMWARRAGQVQFDIFNPKIDDLRQTEEVVVPFLLVGS